MLQLQHLSYARFGAPLFTDLQFHFGLRRYGLVGHNGVGKTTLARLLAGELSPTSGEIRRGSAITYVAQHAPRSDGFVFDEFTDLWSGPVEAAGRIHQWIHELDPSRHLAELSGGEWMKLRLAQAFARPTSFLLLDEPTNDLDRSGREVLHGLIRDFSGGLLVISHDRELLRGVDEILELTPAGLNRFRGAFDAFWEQREHRRTVQRSRLEEAEKERKRADREAREHLLQQEKRMRSGARQARRGGMPKVLLGAKKRQAEATRGRVVKTGRAQTANAETLATEAFAGLETDPFLRLDFESAAPPPEKVLLAGIDLNFRFPGAGEDLWKTDLAFQLHGRDRWHLQGRNGVGKSTLLRLMRGELSGLRRGELHRSERPLAYLDQNQSLLDPNRTVLENCGEDSRFDPIGLRNELAFYGFTGNKVFQKVDTLSGGERLRAALARMFLGPRLPEIIFLDEPTNNLDFQSIELLENALAAFRGLLVVVSHDDAFVDNLDITNVLEVVRETVP